MFRRGNMDLSKLKRHTLVSNATMTIRLSKILGVELVQGAREPKVISIAQATIALLVLFCGWAWGVFVFQPFGDRRWMLMIVSLGLVGVVAVLWPGSRVATAPPLRLERIMGRSLWLGKSVLAGALGCWLGLIGWSAISSGGSLPAANANPAAIRVLTWNILHGTERGMPWTRFGWPVRKNALKTALAAVRPDILCVQEALEEQLDFLAGVLQGHERVGVGRDDGRSAGEQCAIFFDRNRFLELGGGTFWLEEPVDEPACGLRKEHLPAVSGTHDPRRLVHLLPDVLRRVEARLSGVNPYPNPDRRLREGRDRLFDCSNGLSRGGEDVEEPVSCGVDLVAVMARAGRSHDPSLLVERSEIRVAAELLQEPR